MKKKRMTIGIILMLLFGLAYYGYLTYRDASSPSEPETVVTEVDKLIFRDLETDYPNTPRKVVDFYSQITECFYSEDLTEEKLIKLCEQSEKLFDIELLNANPDETFLDNTKAAIEEYAKTGRVVTNYVLESSDDVEYTTQNGQTYATISVKYFLREKDGYGKTYEDFLLRKDGDGRWKIVGWQITPANEQDSDE